MSKDWTEEEDNQLKELIGKDLTIEQISDVMHRSYKSVQHRKSKIMQEEKTTEESGVKINNKEKIELIQVLGKEIVKEFQPLKLFEKNPTLKNGGKKEEHSILDISDVHVGMKNEIYDTDLKKQVVTYNEKIFLEEMLILKKAVFDIHGILSNSYQLRELTINVMGDIITNDRIFPEQPLEIEYTVGKQIWKAIPIFAEFFNSLLAIYDKINVVCIVGNHGRSMPNFQNEPVENSFEYFIYKTWEKQFENSKRIKIIVPETRRYIYNIYGWRHLVEHGDAFRGTSATALERQIEQLYVNMGGFDVFHMGHVHKCKEVEVTDKVICKINGSWIEKDSWAFKCFKTYSLPKQHFCGCNERRPETWSYKLDLRV